MSPEDFRDWRKHHGMTQDQVAKALGVSRQSVYYWEAGVRKITKRTEVALPSVLTIIQTERRLATERRRAARPYEYGCILGPDPAGQYHRHVKDSEYVKPHKELPPDDGNRMVELSGDPVPVGEKDWHYPPDKYGDMDGQVPWRILTMVKTRWPEAPELLHMVWVIFADRGIKGFAPGDAPVLPAAPMADGVPLWAPGARAWHGFSYLRPISDPRRPVPRPKVYDPPPEWGQALDGEALRNSKKISQNSD